MAFQAFLERDADVVGVVRQQNSMFPHRRLYLSNNKDGRLEASNTAQYWTQLLFHPGVIRELEVIRAATVPANGLRKNALAP